MESRPSRNSTAYPRPPRRGSYECCTALHKKRPQPGDGVSALPCNFLADHGVKPVKVLKKAGLRHETQADWHSSAAMPYTYWTWPLSASCSKHFILIVRLPLLLTSNPLSLILTLTLVRPESFLCLLLGAYRDCFHVFLSLCVFLRLHTWRARHSQPLFATRTCVFFVIS
jgi:hypothetical protein